ncbi:hypothetical protein DUNSADRAFT_17032 [Dunaliella salina]|uniref:Glycosyl hydrolase family 32 N-terminal domain-containing protein n=1 Tax=Dunaliella salina TaxID=3046 RepID=A0ABQ7H0G4_DUNSA|nr:hypothetical protein DUNSADRAFT_17032 [Dunaliella salina]|eukprot:KAF5840335.1 hypothetical protein DUNSADRAFT_17032 [Dunaliella salina]
MATLTVGRPLLPLRIPPEVQRGGKAHPHDPHRFTGPELTHLAPRSGWGSDPHGPIYYKGRYHLFYQACHASCQWWW